MGYNFYLKFDLTGGRLHSVITVFQTVLVESTFLTLSLRLVGKPTLIL